MTEMQTVLERLRDGEISFREFEKQTRPRWESYAWSLVRRWAPPPSMSIDDVVQELLLAAWWVLPSFDPHAGPSLRRYVVYNAMALAKRAIHSERKALRLSDKSPSRHAICDPVAIEQAMVEAEQEFVVGRRQLAGHLAQACTPRERAIFDMLLQTACPKTTADLLYADVDVRLQAEWACRAEARREVAALVARLSCELNGLERG